MPSHAHLAIDLGAESGRAIVGTIDGDHLSLHELHRFRHAPVEMPSGLHWDITRLWQQILVGLTAAGKWSRDSGIQIESLGVDTWGVDFALVSQGGELMGLPHCYRDAQHQLGFQRLTQSVPPSEIYEATGIQLMPINSIYQLNQRKEINPAMLAASNRLLFMPDLFHTMLGSKPVNELTIASTSQMVDPRTGKWASALLTRARVPPHILGELVMPGTWIGALSPEIADRSGLPQGTEIFTPAGHDTASAVAAVPAADGDARNWCFLSSGTWSLLGAELDAPCMTEGAMRGNFTNELGVASSGRPTVRFLKNIVGLWMVQECKRHFDSQPPLLEYDELSRLAGASTPFRTLLNVALPIFVSPGNMPGKISDYASRTGQPVPETRGEFVRACLESLALAYRETLTQLEAVLGRRFDVIHAVGGGSRNRLLNQMTADATGRRVVAGPSEATAAGNILVQAMGACHVPDLAAIRRMVAHSFAPEVFIPRDTAIWERVADKYEQLARLEENKVA